MASNRAPGSTASVFVVLNLGHLPISAFHAEALRDAVNAQISVQQRLHEIAAISPEVAFLASQRHALSQAREETFNSDLAQAIRLSTNEMKEEKKTAHAADSHSSSLNNRSSAPAKR